MGCHNEYRYMAAVSSVPGTASDMAHSTIGIYGSWANIMSLRDTAAHFLKKISVGRSKKYLMFEINQSNLAFLMSVTQGHFNYYVT